MRKSVYTKKQKSLLAALKKARQEAGMTQQHLADALEKPQSFVAKVEGGERRLDVIEFIALCEILGLSASSLVADLED